MISQKVNETAYTADQVNECKTAVADLNDMIQKFKL